MYLLRYFSSYSVYLVAEVNRNMNFKALTQFYISVVEYYPGSKGRSATVSIQELLNASDDEIKIWEYILTTWSNGYIKTKNEHYSTITTYNGILADTTNLLGEFSSYEPSNYGRSKICFLTILLNKACLPEVDVAREQIIGFSLENAFNLSKIQKKLGILDDKSHFISNKDLLITENKLFELLRNNRNLENEIWKDINNNYTISEFQEELKSKKIIGIGINCHYRTNVFFALAVLKKYFTVYYKKGDYLQKLYIGKKTEENTGTEAFPVTLFFSFIDNTPKFAEISYDYYDDYYGLFTYNINHYNKNHPFSQWLMTHQKELMEKVQGVYNDMIKTMVEGTNATDIMNFLNKSLKFLQQYQHNHFQINNDIFLKPEDFS